MDASPGKPVITVVSAVVAPDREADLVSGYHELMATRPDGLVRSELLRGQQGTWRIQSLWRDLASLQAVRASGSRPAALELFERVGAEHSHDFAIVEAAYGH